MEQRMKTFLKKQPSLVKLYRKIKAKSLFKTTYKKSIKVTNNKLRFGKSALLVECKIDIIGNNNNIIVEDLTFLKNVEFSIRGNNNKIVLSKSVRFNQGGSLRIEDDGCLISIGEESSFVHTDIVVNEPNSKAIIGRDCLFAYNVDMRTGDSHSIIDITTNKRINYAKDIVIGNHVWVASHVSILKGVHFPSNS